MFRILQASILAGGLLFLGPALRADDKDKSKDKKTTEVKTDRAAEDVTTGRATSDKSRVSSDDKTINIISPDRTEASTERALGERTEVGTDATTEKARDTEKAVHHGTEKSINETGTRSRTADVATEKKATETKVDKKRDDSDTTSRTPTDK